MRLRRGGGVARRLILLETRRRRGVGVAHRLILLEARRRRGLVTLTHRLILLESRSLTWGLGSTCVRLRLRWRTGRSDSLGGLLGRVVGTSIGIGEMAVPGRILDRAGQWVDRTAIDTIAADWGGNARMVMSIQ